MCHVLIEDEWFIADHLQQLVETTGAHSISLADIEDEAVRQASLRRPEVITSDVSLRVGTGSAVVSRIVDLHGPTPCLFVTGEPRQSLPTDPISRVVRKPFADHDLIAAFVELVPTRERA